MALQIGEDEEDLIKGIDPRVEAHAPCTSLAWVALPHWPLCRMRPSAGSEYKHREFGLGRN